MIKDYIVVSTELLFKEESDFVGVGGKKILIDTSWTPEKHIKNWGTVVSVPRTLSADKIVVTESLGHPDYYDLKDGNNIRYRSDIDMDIKAGDVAFFRYSAIESTFYANSKNILSVEIVNGRQVYFIRIPIEEVYCAIRGEEVIMQGSWTFVAPKTESWEDITHWIPVVINGKPVVNPDGSPSMKPILVKKAPGTAALEGIVEHIGKPFKGEVCDLNVGDHVIYKRYANAPVSFLGKQLFVMRQKNIEGIVRRVAAYEQLNAYS